jgi:hypothetical protein
MASFSDQKITIWVHFEVRQWKKLVNFERHLVNLTAISCFISPFFYNAWPFGTFSSYGMSGQEKSGNPVCF